MQCNLVKSTKITEFADAKTRRQRVEDRESAILSAARDMFNAKGYDKTTISRIAKESGVADGTVYLYFKNKEALSRGVLAQFYHDLTETAQRGVDKRDNPKSRLRFLAKHHLTEIIKNRRLLEALPQHDLAIDNYEGSDLYKMNRSYVAVFDRVAKDGLAQGLIHPDLTPWVLRDMFFGAMDYASRTILIKGKREDAQIFIDGMIAMLTQGHSVKTAVRTPENDAFERLNAITERLEHATQALERKL